MYTKEQMIEAYREGVREQSPSIFRDFGIVITNDAMKYVNALAQYTVDPSGADAPRIALEASTTDDRRVCEGLYLPPVGTPEEVLARVVASFMCRAFMVFSGGVQPETLFNAEWYWPAMDALRNAYPVLGTFEDARVEEKV